MDKSSEPSLFLDKKVGVSSLIFFIIICLLGLFPLEINQKGEFGLGELLEENLAFSESIVIQGNSLLAVSGHILTENSLVLTQKRPLAKQKITVVVTAYSSSSSETDDTPYLTASGTLVRDGIVATNILPFGTKIKLPELYKDKVFIVEDRMSLRKGYHVDIWFPNYLEALNFGVKKTYIEIVQEA